MRFERLIAACGSGFVVSAVVYGCVTPPKHPGNPGARDEVCTAMCTRGLNCGAAGDLSKCVNGCRSRTNSRFQHVRTDFIQSIEACVERTPCGPNLAERLRRQCVHETALALVSTPRARAACERRFEKTQYCVMTTISVDKCLEHWKMYTDEILADLDECASDHICSNYERCLKSVMGPDVYWDDPDRAKEWRERPVAAAPPTHVRFEGTATVGGAPWPGVVVCVDQHPEIPCFTTGSDGHFLLTLPASVELAVTLGGAGLANTIVGVTTVSHDMKGWQLSTDRMDLVAARYQDAGSSLTDSARGSILVSLLGPRRVGVAGMTVGVATAGSGRVAYLTREGRPSPDFTATTVFGRALVLDVPAGVVEVVIGPDGAMCTPLSGWAGQTVNRVRVPVVAGRETRVGLRCAP